MKKKLSVLVLHGPNLNLLGSRETDVYGALTLDQINQAIQKKGTSLGLKVDCFQSNHEGEMVEKIQSATKTYQALIINPAAYTNTSIAIRDALLGVHLPTIEVHLSNIYKREDFRQHSYISSVVLGQISGLGIDGYLLALEAIKNHFS